MGAHDNRAPRPPEQVRRLFDRIAPRYEFNDRLFSLGLDAWWRRWAARRVRPVVPGPLLDAATGSAQLALAIARRHPERQIVGLDFSPGMLAIARAKLRLRAQGSRLLLVEGDLLNLPFADGTFAAATTAFGIRNVGDRRRALAELRRVLKPGGRLVVVEFGLPRLPVLGALYRFYFGVVMKAAARLLGTGEAFAYLYESVRAFPDDRTFLAMLAETGFRRGRVTPLTLGTLKVFEGEAAER